MGSNHDTYTNETRRRRKREGEEPSISENNKIYD
jgi:hypothetical protein